MSGFIYMLNKTNCVYKWIKGRTKTAVESTHYYDSGKKSENSDKNSEVDEYIYKFFQILLRYKSFNPWYVLKVIVGWLHNHFNVAVEVQVRVHDHTQISGLVCGFQH